MGKIKKYLNKEYIKTNLKKLLEKGFFAIFTGTFLIKVISFCSTLLLPRVFGDTDLYGILSIVENFNSYLILIGGLGLANSVMRFCVLKETYAEKRAVFSFCLRLGTCINTAILIVIASYLALFDFRIPGVRMYLFVGLAIPMLSYIFDCVTLFLRADMKNREYAKLSVLYAALFAGLQVLLAIPWKVNGALVGRYLAFGTALVIGFLMIKNNTDLFKQEKTLLSRADKKEICGFALGGLFSNAFSMIMPINEQMVVTMVLVSETQVAYYKAASIIPTQLQFVANAIIIFVYPYFVQHTKDLEWVWQNAKKLMLAMLGVIGLIVLVMFPMSGWLIDFIYGADYMPALPLMRVMWLCFAVNAVFRLPLGNVIGAIGKVKFSAINGGVTAGCHILLDIFFIKNFGIGGAAVALSIAYLGSGIANLIYLNHIVKKARLEQPEEA